jgi:PIN domain nuclease of toxin-antitoxin system
MIGLRCNDCAGYPLWVWWVSQTPQWTTQLDQLIQAHQATALGVRLISCWEVAKLVEVGRLQLTITTFEWLNQALAYPGVQLLDLTVSIIVESTQLPGTFHRDPADQIIVATARVYNVPILTIDSKILAYPHVQTL